MGSVLLGATLALLSAQEDQPRAEPRLPFESGQLRLVSGLRGYGPCAASGRGRGYEAFAATLCAEGAGAPPPGGRRTIVIGFARAGERQQEPVAAAGRRLYDLEAEVALAASGAFNDCRIVREQGPSHLFLNRARACDALLQDRPLFAAATGSGLRRGRLRISIFVDAPPAEIANLLRPPPPMPRIMAPPPIIMTTPPAPPPPPPPMPSSAAGSPPRAINRHGWITSDDYPAAALRAEEQGTVNMRLSIDPAGRVSACTVTASSGSTVLDAAGCRLLRSRGRYRPARDARGRPTTGSIAERIRWVLPEFDALRRAPAYAALSIGVDGGARTLCESIEEVPDDAALASTGCRLIVPPGRPAPAAIAQGGAAVRIVLELAVEGMPRPAFEPQQGRTIFAAGAALQLGPEGDVADCRMNVIVAPRDPGTPPFDLCGALMGTAEPLFEPRPGSAPQPARLILTVLESVRR